MGKRIEKIKGPIFYKESTDASEQLAKLKEFYRVAPESVKPQVERDIKMLSYGIKGEDNVAFELKNSFLPCIVLRDLHIVHAGLSAQIDFFVVTKKIILIIECKNLIGNIEVRSNGEFIRTVSFGGKKIREGIYSPITQKQRHLDMLKKIRGDDMGLLDRALFNKFFEDNYKSVVVLANPKTIINMRFAKKEIKEQIIRSDQLVDYIKQLHKKTENLNSSDKQMYSLAERFLGYHTPSTTDFTKKYVTDVVAEKVETKEVAAGQDLDNTPLYQELRKFRLTKCKEEGVKPYWIYSNSQMEELIKLMPKTIEEIKSISGFGDVKCEKYGGAILEILNKHRK